MWEYAGQYDIKCSEFSLSSGQFLQNGETLLFILFSLCARRFCPEMIPVMFLISVFVWWANFGGLFLRYIFSNSLFSCFMFDLFIFFVRLFIIFVFRVSLMSVLGRNRNGSGPVCLSAAPCFARESACSFLCIPMCAFTLWSITAYILLNSFKLFTVSMVNLEFDSGLFSFCNAFRESVNRLMCLAFILFVLRYFAASFIANISAWLIVAIVPR